MSPLQGIKVVDLSNVVFGPLASQNLADYGAEVIKVEAPEGDSTRYTGPSPEIGMSALFLGCNRNKKSVVLNLKDGNAQDALMKLLETADVFMHSMRPQKLAGLGIDAESLTKRFPSLIYAGLHGFAEAGPYAGRPAYDDVIQGMSGLSSLMERQSGEYRYLPTIGADKTCALVATQAILAALVRRSVTGAGGFVEIPMFETMTAFNLVEHLYGQHFEPQMTDAGYPRVLTKWRRPWRTSDGQICMMPYTDMHWRRFFSEVGRPDLAVDPQFSSMAARTANIALLLETAGAFVANAPTADWLATCERLEIPAAAVTRIDDLINDKHLAATNFFTLLDDPHMGQIRFAGIPVLFDGERPNVRMAPRLGEHTISCLTEAGVSKAEIAHMVNSGAVFNAVPKAKQIISN